MQAPVPAPPEGFAEPQAPPGPPPAIPFVPGNTIGTATRFQPGKSGNSAGRPKGKKVVELEDKCREYSDTMIDVWTVIALDAKASHRDRIRAAEMVVAYGMGKPRQAITVSGEEGKPPVLVDSVTQMLERIIKVGAGALVPALPPQPSGGADEDAASPRGADDAPPTAPNDEGTPT